MDGALVVFFLEQKFANFQLARRVYQTTIEKMGKKMGIRNNIIGSLIDFFPHGNMGHTCGLGHIHGRRYKSSSTI
jgi:hypothetical protein